MNPKFEELKNRMMERGNITRAIFLLQWDQQTMMPPKGAQARAEQLATLARISHEKLTSPEIGRLLEELRSYEKQLPYDSSEASFIRVTRESREKQARIPAGLSGDMQRTASMARAAWAEARQQSDYAILLPHLEKTMELKRRYIECFESYEDPYDILLGDNEIGITTTEVRRIFDALKRDLVPFVASISPRSDLADNQCLRGYFPIDHQREFCVRIVSRFGLNPDSFRIDHAANSSLRFFSTNDIRIVVKFAEDSIAPALFESMRQGGDGLYLNNIDAELEGTPIICRAASFSWGYSQMWLWENPVGRSRSFWKYLFPILRETFPDQFSRIELETFYRAINKIRPGMLLAEADAATYGLHVILRFELEQDMIHGKIPLRELPEAWNAKMKAYLGLDVPNDAQGVLQDVFWAAGNFGNLPINGLGNLIGAQIWEKVSTDITDLDAQFEQGEFQPLRAWLTERIYRHGGKFTPQEMRQRVLGGPIDVGPFIRYLKKKYADIYGL